MLSWNAADGSWPGLRQEIDSPAMKYTHLAPLPPPSPDVTLLTRCAPEPIPYPASGGTSRLLM